jgi:hypothetical protein
MVWTTKRDRKEKEMKKIDWTPDIAARKAGITVPKLTGGVVAEETGVGRVVRFEQKFRGKVVSLRLDTRPELAAYVASLEAEEKREKEEKIAANKAELERSIASGEAFLTLEIAAQYGAEIQYARRFRESEKAKYAEWFQSYGMVGFSASERTEIDSRVAYDFMAGRKVDGQFPGCENNAWIITADDMAMLVRLSQVETERKEDSKAIAEAEEIEDIQRKIETGYCFSCGTWCYGDCGHYSQDPMVEFRQDLKQALKEQNYGIEEG